MNMYLRNAWYMAGWANEVGDNGLARMILGKPVYLYRLKDGSPAAILDRCPHRFAPLSKGERDGDVLICGYHGLRFDGDGQCVHNPFGDKIPTGSSVRTYAVVEQDDIVWMWGGEAREADPSLIPDFAFIPDSSTNRTVAGYTLMHANYEYGTDNLMDLSHIEFVHKGTFAGQGVIFAGDHSVKVDGDTLHSNWWMPKVSPPSVAHGIFPPDAAVDHWLDMRWNAPASMRLNVGVCPHGSPREAGFEVPQAHILTPANEHETHYFWSSSRSNDLDSTDVDGFLKAMFGAAFDEEDKPMIEAAYTNVRGNLDTGGNFWDEKPLFLGVDAGGTRARRQLEAMIKRENTHG
jgi:phenylpropionate dioxygenase-like ring-hydroxylating dioxygenase large terminal subunit